MPEYAATSAAARGQVRPPIDGPAAQDQGPGRDTSGRKDMKFRTLAAGAAALAMAGAAAAQGVTINDYVRGLVAEMADEGETLVGSIILGEISEGESFTHTFRLDPEKSYFVYGACDDDCGDIDLLGEDADGEWVDEDAEDDYTPILIVLPGESGDSLTVTLDLAVCDTDICVVGMGLYEADL